MVLVTDASELEVLSPDLRTANLVTPRRDDLRPQGPLAGENAEPAASLEMYSATDIFADGKPHTDLEQRFI